MDNFMFAFILLLVSTFIARATSTKATNKLDQDKKAELLDLFSRNGIYSFGILIVIVILYFGNLKFAIIEARLSTIIFYILLLAFISISSYLSYQKLKINNFPKSYIQSYLLAMCIRFAGLILFIALIKV